MEKARSSQDPNASVMRKLYVTYGICKLLQSLSKSNPVQEVVNPKNFAVGELHHTPIDANYNAGWEVIDIQMIDPPILVELASENTPEDEASNKEIIGRDVSAIVVGTYHPIDEVVQCAVELDEMQLCSSLGQLLHFLFSGEQIVMPREEIYDKTAHEDGNVQPAKKQTRESFFPQALIHSGSYCPDTSVGGEMDKASLRFPLLSDYGCPTSISLVSS